MNQVTFEPSNHRFRLDKLREKSACRKPTLCQLAQLQPWKMYRLLLATAITIAAALSAMPADNGGLQLGIPTVLAGGECIDDIIQNGSFEVNKNGWLEDNADSGRSTTYAIDGSYYLWIRPAASGVTGRVYQEISGIQSGTTLELTFGAGSHRPESYLHEGYIEFLNEGGTVIGTSTKVDIDFDVENAPPVIETYTLQATAPAGTSSVRVVFALDGDYIKLDHVRMEKCDPLGSIGDTVWSDPDDDGNNVIDGDDFPIKDVVVRLLNSDGVVVNTDATDEFGAYLFNELALGTYTVEIDTETLPDVKQGNPAYDPDGGDDNRSTVTITDEAPNNRDQDFAYFQTLGSIGDTIWSDPNDDGNGIIDNDDFPIQGVVVRLLDGDGNVLDSDTTDDAGQYLFTQLPLNQTYTIRVDTSTLPDVKQGNPAYDPDGGDDNQSEVTLTVDNPNRRDQDFAYFQTLGSIGDTVWSDVDDDGNNVIDGDDFPIKDVVVQLLDSDGNVLDRDTTNSSGQYLFENLPLNETYTVRVDTETLPDVKQGNPAYDPDGGDDNQSTVTLTVDNPDRRDQDFAYFQTLGSIGDTIWSDVDNDGNNAVDGDDFPIEGVVVTLLNGDGAAIDTDTTDSEGKYLFTQLPLNQTYTVQVDTSTLPDVKQVNPAYDPDGGDDNQSEVTLTIGSPDNRDQDFAYYQTLGSIGDTVWSDPDDDGNGLIDGDDFPISGVVVNLLDSDGNLITTDTTGRNGNYLFEDLPLNQMYIVEVDTSTLPDVKQGNPSYDADGGDDNRSSVTLTLDAPDDRNQDFAYYQTATPVPTATSTATPANTPLPPTPTPTVTQTPVVLASLGDKVWQDLNGNGMQDDREPGVADVVVNLWSESGGEPDTYLGTTTTSELGMYSFSELDPSQNYIVQFILPDGMIFTSHNSSADTSDSDAEPSSGLSHVVELDPGENDPTIDAGMVDEPSPTPEAPAALGNRVWKDANKNGIQDSGETGVDGVTINLWLADDNGMPVSMVDTMMTSEGGQYEFAGLMPGQPYLVQLDTSTIPNECAGLTTPDAGDDTDDSDMDPSTGISSVVVLEPGETDTSVDAGLVPATTSIGNRVWKDANSNGIQDEGEAGVPGVAVTLWTDDDGNGTPDTQLGTVETDPNGVYLFTDLDPAKSYIVQFEQMPTMPYTTPNESPDEEIDSDVDPTSGTTEPITVEPGENKTDVDAGMTDLPASLGDLVWKDRNENGVQDEGEVGVPGVAVALWSDDDGNGTPDTKLTEVETDEKGFYLFTDLDPHMTYIVQVTSPVDCTITQPDQGGDEQADSDVDPETGISAPIQLDAGETNMSVDVGLVPNTAALGNTVWKDDNENGIQDEGENGIGFVTVNLWVDEEGDGLPDTMLTSSQTTPLGQYLFTDLDPSLLYIVQVEVPVNCEIGLMDQGDDDSKDSDIDPTTSISPPVKLEPGETNTTVDIGLTPSTATASLGNYVWLDENANGLQDDGEPGVQGVSVTLLNAAGEPIANTTTDEDGGYSFDRLVPGLYAVHFELPGNTYFFTIQSTLDEALDSDVDPATGQTVVTELVENENDPKWDAGLVAPPILDVQKTASSDVIQQGEIIDFTIVYENLGLSEANGVVITELVPEYTTLLLDQSTPGWQCENGNVSAGSVCTFDVGTVAALATSEVEIHFVVQIDKVLDTNIRSLLNQIQMNDDNSHPSGLTGQSVDEVLVVVRHPTSLGSIDEEDANSSRSFVYLPIVRRNLFKEAPSTLLTADEWTAVWACAVATSPQLQWNESNVDWATSVCAEVNR